MNNINKKTKIILFAGIIVAMILPFSYIEMVDAAPHEKADKTKKEKENTPKTKSKEYNYEPKRNYEKKDYHNYKADKILKELESFTLIMPDSENPTAHTNNALDMVKMKKLEKEFLKIEKEHIDKIIDKELRKELKKARQLIKDSGIPIKVLATGIDHVYIQLSKENAKYEEKIIEIMGDLPYLLEYGEGFKRSSCYTTSSNCNWEVGGIKIAIENFLLIPLPSTVCSLSVPMMKDGVDGFLTAAHCFGSTTTENVYQPDTSDEDYLIGYSNSTWRSFVDDGECDCAWIKDTSSTTQKSGVYSTSNFYYPMFGIHSPTLGESVKLRGFQSSNGTAQHIDYDDIEIVDWWGLGKTTINLMSFETPVQGGDSGGAVIRINNYTGILVGGGDIDGEQHAIFVPWDHIRENISGLELSIHPPA